MKIKKVIKSNISNVDFKNLNFGSVFSDHMFSCSYKNGEWTNAEIKPYQPIRISPSARVFHYGQACFEGMKAFKDKKVTGDLFSLMEGATKLSTVDFVNELKKNL